MDWNDRNPPVSDVGEPTPAPPSGPNQSDWKDRNPEPTTLRNSIAVATHRLCPVVVTVFVTVAGVAAS